MDETRFLYAKPCFFESNEHSVSTDRDVCIMPDAHIVALMNAVWPSDPVARIMGAPRLQHRPHNANRTNR